MEAAIEPNYRPAAHSLRLLEKHYRAGKVGGQERQGRSWNAVGADRLLRLKLLMNHERKRTGWWQKPCAFNLSKPP